MSSNFAPASSWQLPSEHAFTQVLYPPVRGLGTSWSLSRSTLHCWKPQHILQIFSHCCNLIIHCGSGFAFLSRLVFSIPLLSQFRPAEGGGCQTSSLIWVSDLASRRSGITLFWKTQWTQNIIHKPQPEFSADCTHILSNIYCLSAYTMYYTNTMHKLKLHEQWLLRVPISNVNDIETKRSEASIMGIFAKSKRNEPVE